MLIRYTTATTCLKEALRRKSGKRKEKKRKTKMSQNESGSQNKTEIIYQSKLTPEVGTNKEGKYDCVAFVIFCPEHQRIAVSHPKGVDAVWLPFTPLTSGRSWTEGAIAGALIILSGGDNQQFLNFRHTHPFDQIHCMQVMRLQLPTTMKFITRLIYYVHLSKANAQFKCCTKTDRIQWISRDFILGSYVEYLWGPELVEFTRLSGGDIIQQRVHEYSLEEAFFYVPRDPPRNLEEAMLKSIHITEKDVERLYEDFIEHCFPSTYQTLESFKSYMAKYGFEKNDERLCLLFHAFDYHNNGYLWFHQLLIGLATMEPNSVHGESRVRFIFRYYDLNSSETLNVDEFTKMICDINPNCPDNVIRVKVSEGLQMMGTKDANGNMMITSKDFIAAVGSHRFRGTSNLCRSSKAIFTQISRTIAARTLKNVKANPHLGTILKQFQGKCQVCKRKEYTLATHAVHMNATGQLVAINQIIENEEPSSDTFMSAQRYSIEYVFNPASAANITIKLIQKFNLNKGTNKEPKGLLQNEPDKLWQLLLAIHNDIDILLNEETKCAKVQSPCYIIGDIHGNLEDLLSLEKSIWPRLPCMNSNYVFNGDYVDRGQWGFECSLYLFAFKILAPNKVTLLRGNHEVRSLQVHYSYKRECVLKYGEVLGIKVWEITNKVYDKLPVCAVIDDSIYCAHGGIPHSARKLDEINKVTRSLPDPERQSSIAWEILWSDPCHNQQFVEICNLLKVPPEKTGGFIRNTKRGTAFLFNEDGADSFLKNNNLTHIVRAHEVPQTGYTFHFGNKCATIFSCSHYCGNNNACSCILADMEILRVISLDTVNNAPATD